MNQLLTWAPAVFAAAVLAVMIIARRDSKAARALAEAAALRAETALADLRNDLEQP